jgi:hypothetical protein
MSEPVRTSQAVSKEATRKQNQLIKIKMQTEALIRIKSQMRFLFSSAPRKAYWRRNSIALAPIQS